MADIPTAFLAFLGTLLILAAIPKLYDRRRFHSSLKQFVLIPGAASAGLSVAVPVIELVLGLLLVLQVGVTFVAPLVTILFLSFVVIIVGNLRAGVTRIDCGCFGEGSRRLTPIHAVAGLMLGLLALLSLIAPATTTASAFGTPRGLLMVALGIYAAHVARIGIELNTLREAARDRVGLFYGDS